MARRAKRLHCNAEKTIVSLNISQLSIPRRLLLSKEWEQESELSICFEKGGKLAASEAIHLNRQSLLNSEGKDDDSVPNELINVILPNNHIVLELPITIYRDKKTDQVQEKVCQIILRKRVRTPPLNRRSSSHSFASVDNKYGVNVDSFVGISKFSLKLHELLASMTYVSSSYDSVDLFVPFDLSTGIVMRLTLGVFLTSSGGSNIFASEESRGGADVSVIEENMSMISDLTDISALGALFSTKAFPSQSDDIRASYATPSVPKERSDVTPAHNPPIDQRLVKEREESIQRLEDELRRVHQQHETEKAQLTWQIQELQTKIVHEEYARQLLSDVTLKTDKELARDLARIREESSEYHHLYESTAFEAQLLREKVTYLQQTADRLSREKQEEREATRQATEVVAQAMLQKAVLQEENEALISELVETKLQLANSLTERQVEQKKLFTLRKALQVYAEQAALLELKLLTWQRSAPPLPQTPRCPSPPLRECNDVSDQIEEL